jgi:hypothetical protein
VLGGPQMVAAGHASPGLLPSEGHLSSPCSRHIGSGTVYVVAMPVWGACAGGRPWLLVAAWVGELLPRLLGNVEPGGASLVSCCCLSQRVLVGPEAVVAQSLLTMAGWASTSSAATQRPLQQALR